MKTQVKKELKALLSNRMWELKLKMTMWQYKQVIIPEITYAAIAYWDRMVTALQGLSWNVYGGPHINNIVTLTCYSHLDAKESL